jgi:hypothetical protein
MTADEARSAWDAYRVRPQLDGRIPGLMGAWMFDGLPDDTYSARLGQMAR